MKINRDYDQVEHVAVTTQSTEKADLPYSQKIWRGIKFSGLSVLGETENPPKFIPRACMYIWRYSSRPPNLNPLIHSLGANRQI